jgi:hypothetical protein
MNDEGYSIALDSGGNVVVCGYTMGALPGYSLTGYSDLFLAKWDPDGTQVWVKQMGSANLSHPIDLATSVAIDSADTLYFAGYGNGEFDGHANTGKTDILLAGFTPDGTAPETGALWTIGFVPGGTVPGTGVLWAGGRAPGVTAPAPGVLWAGVAVPAAGGFVPAGGWPAAGAVPGFCAPGCGAGCTGSFSRVKSGALEPGAPSPKTWFCASPAFLYWSLNRSASVPVAAGLACVSSGFAFGSGGGGVTSIRSTGVSGPTDTSPSRTPVPATVPVPLFAQPETVAAAISTSVKIPKDASHLFMVIHMPGN